MSLEINLARRVAYGVPESESRTMSLEINLARRVAYGVPESDAESDALDDHHCRCSTWSAKGFHCPAGSRCSMRMRQPGPSFRNVVWNGPSGYSKTSSIASPFRRP